MKKPKISIITVCYNSEAHIEEAIQSVISQTYDNKEYVVIDGGSTDSTLSIVEKYKDKIDYFISEPDRGISDAFNKGIKASTGDIIGICNSDDVLADDVLTKVANVWGEDVDIYRLDEVIRNFITGEEWLCKPTLEFNKRLIGCKVCHMGCYITRKAYEKYGMYDTEFRSSMDVELLRRFTVYEAKYKYLPVICGYFRRGGASGNPSRRNKERNIIIRRYGGSTWDVLSSMSYHISRQWLKRLLNILGEDAATKFESYIRWKK